MSRRYSFSEEMMEYAETIIPQLEALLDACEDEMGECAGMQVGVALDETGYAVQGAMLHPPVDHRGPGRSGKRGLKRRSYRKSPLDLPEEEY